MGLEARERKTSFGGIAHSAKLQTLSIHLLPVFVTPFDLYWVELSQNPRNIHKSLGLVAQENRNQTTLVVLRRSGVLNFLCEPL